MSDDRITRRGSIISPRMVDGKHSIVTRKGYPIGRVWRVADGDWRASSGGVHCASGKTMLEAADAIEDLAFGEGRLAIGKDADGKTVFA